MTTHRTNRRLSKKERNRLLKLVDQGLSYTRVANQIGRHRNTVYNHVKARQLLAARGKRLDEDDSSDKTRRCPACGVLCDMPCVGCEARLAAAKRTAING